MSLLNMLVQEFTDRYLQENFKRLNTFGKLPGLALLGFTRLEINLVEAVTKLKVPHGLGYVPKDIMVTWTTGPALVQFNYDDFDAINIVLSVVVGTPTKTTPQLLRCLVGDWDQGNS